MPSTREMREHIESIENIGQMTRALQAVSASRVRQAVRMAEESRRYSETSYDVMVDMFLSHGAKTIAGAYYKREEVKSALVIFISADRGLAGSFPLNIFREVVDLEKELKGVPVHYVTVGKKGREMLLRRRKSIVADFSNMRAESIRDTYVRALRNIVLREYFSHTADRVYLVYTMYHSVSHYNPTTLQLLPLDRVCEDWIKDHPRDRAASERRYYIYDEDPKQQLDALVRRVIGRLIYHSVLSSRASEHSARMLAMSNATENAEDLASDLYLEYNKMRQQSITNDLLDVSAGAEAQEQDVERLLKQKEHLIHQED